MKKTEYVKTNKQRGRGRPPKNEVDVKTVKPRTINLSDESMIKLATAIREGFNVIDLEPAELQQMPLELSQDTINRLVVAFKGDKKYPYYERVLVGLKVVGWVVTLPLFLVGVVCYRIRALVELIKWIAKGD